MRGQRAKELLKQYVDAGKEIEETESFIEKLKGGIVVDSVIGSSPNYPYTEHKVLIEGIPHSKIERQTRKLNKQVKECMDIQDEVIDFIGSIPDSRTRRIFMMRYFEGQSWLKISRSFGANYEAYARIIHDRYLDNI